jgi:hypothetical protein
MDSVQEAYDTAIADIEKQAQRYKDLHKKLLGINRLFEGMYASSPLNKQKEQVEAAMRIMDEVNAEYEKRDFTNVNRYHEAMQHLEHEQNNFMFQFGEKISEIRLKRREVEEHDRGYTEKLMLKGLKLPDTPAQYGW